MTDYQIVQAMRACGGSFARALAEAFDRADLDNQARIKIAFPELWEEYRNLARMREERARAST